MPHCPHGRVYQYDVPLDCPKCDREKREREQAEEIAYETLEATRESVRTQNQILANLQTAKLDISSSPQGADVELDGSFVGNTPSTIGVPSGSHTLRIIMSGYAPWERTIKTSSGIVTISAALIPSPCDALPKNTAEVPATATSPQVNEIVQSRNDLEAPPAATAKTELKSTASCTSDDSLQRQVKSLGRPTRRASTAPRDKNSSGPLDEAKGSLHRQSTPNAQDFSSFRPVRLLLVVMILILGLVVWSNWPQNPQRSSLPQPIVGVPADPPKARGAPTDSPNDARDKSRSEQKSLPALRAARREMTEQAGNGQRNTAAEAGRTTAAAPQNYVLSAQSPQEPTIPIDKPATDQDTKAASAPVQIRGCGIYASDQEQPPSFRISSGSIIAFMIQPGVQFVSGGIDFNDSRHYALKAVDIEGHFFVNSDPVMLEGDSASDGLTGTVSWTMSANLNQRTCTTLVVVEGKHKHKAHRK